MKTEPRMELMLTDETDLFGEPVVDAAKDQKEARPKPVGVKSARTPKVYRDLDELECLATKIVGKLSYSVGCFDKRFAREHAGVTKATEGQMAQVWRLIWRYRRQIAHERRKELLAVAQVRGAVDFRTRNKETLNHGWNR